MASGLSKQFCPKCESTDIASDLSAASGYGIASVDMKICRKCGFQGSFFPVKDH